MSIRTIRADNNEYMPIWEAREFYRDPSTTYWLYTDVGQAGFVECRNLTEVIKHALIYHADTYRMTTSWGTDVFVGNLIPEAISELAVKALSRERT